MASEILAFQVKPPQWIFVSEGPWKKGGKLEKISLTQFEKITSSVFREEVKIEQPIKAEEITNKIISENCKLINFTNQLKKDLDSAFNKVVFSNLGPFGFGVFARVTIPKGVALGIYAGTIRSGSSHDTSDESIRLSESYFISTKSHRGMTSFFQHLPKKSKYTTPEEYLNAKIHKNNNKLLYPKYTMQSLQPEIQELLFEASRNYEFYGTEFNDISIKDRIQTENIKTRFCLYKNLPLFLFTASREIKVGEQIGVSYGPNYWEARNATPRFFFQNGSVVPLKLYKRVLGVINLPGNLVIKHRFQNLIESIKVPVPYLRLQKSDEGPPCIIETKDLLIALVNAHAIHVFISEMGKARVDELLAADKSLNNID